MTSYAISAGAFLLLVTCLNESLADDLEHRRSIARVALLAEERNIPIGFPFPSTGEAGFENGRFTRSSGMPLINVSSTAASAYDTTVVHDISGFYKSQNLRYRFILNYLEPMSKSFVSLGIDSGTKTEKLTINKSLFIGLTKAITIQKNNFIYASAGHWFGGKISESPCLDSYGREYYCPNLTAWTDRPNLVQMQEKYIEIKYILKF
jgi:hypothetical protein